MSVFVRDVFYLGGASLVNPEPDTSPDEILYNIGGLRLEDSSGDPITVGEWLGAGATTRAMTIGGPSGARTDVRLSLYGLVPLGVYSVFWLTLEPDSVHPLCPNVERSLPLDAFKPDSQVPDANSFVADATGTAEFHGRVEGDLLAAGSFYYSVVYHSDGLTYYPFPNRGESFTQGDDCRSSFGLDAMRQLIIAQKLPA